MDEYLLAALEAEHRDWLRSELKRLGLGDDPGALRRTIDDIATELGARYTLGGWQSIATQFLEVRAAVRHVVDAALRQGLIPEPVPADPRERALHLRKHRNTGPAKSVPGARRQFGARR